MKNKLVITALYLAVLFLSLFTFHMSARAGGCGNTDKWATSDKTVHFALGAGLGMAGSLHGDGFYSGMKWSIIGAAGKEVLDGASGTGTCSVKDFAATVLGGVVGSSLGVGLSIIRERNTTTVTISKVF